jgi:hypothetical protein
MDIEYADVGQQAEDRMANESEQTAGAKRDKKA